MSETENNFFCVSSYLFLYKLLNKKQNKQTFINLYNIISSSRFVQFRFSSHSISRNLSLRSSSLQMSPSPKYPSARKDTSVVETIHGKEVSFFFSNSGKLQNHCLSINNKLFFVFRFQMFTDGWKIPILKKLSLL